MGCLCYLGTVALVRMPTGRNFLSCNCPPPAPSPTPSNNSPQPQLHRPCDPHIMMESVGGAALFWPVFTIFYLTGGWQRVHPVYFVWCYPDRCSVFFFIKPWVLFRSLAERTNYQTGYLISILKDTTITIFEGGESTGTHHKCP